MNLEDLRRLDPPDLPGVYLMRDSGGRILYVGKAVSLKKRLASYFRPPEQLEPKTLALVQRLANIETLVTENEVQALILEYNLIKKHRPRYNILMRDDKSYPYLKLTVQEPYPRLLMTRKPFADEAKYFGPFLLGSLAQTARFLSLSFGLRLCRHEFQAEGGRVRPCLYAQMGQCDAVCQGRQGPEAYAARVQALLDFLQGGRDPLTPELEAKMARASENQEYERAAELRDQINVLSEIRNKPLLSSTGREDRDAVGLARHGAAATVEIFTVRAGNLEGRRHFLLQHVGTDAAEEILSQVLTQYYSLSVPVPPEILLPGHPAAEKVLRAWLAGRRGGGVRLRVPRAGDGRRLVKLAETNAWLFLKHSAGGAAQELNAEDLAALTDLAKRLGLPGPPLRVEAYDISNIAGTDAVGSRVVFVNGRPDKTQYRHYRIRGVTGPNDYAMLQEVLDRRFRRLKEEGGAVPDLVVVDGGAGQLSATLAVLQELSLAHLPAIGLAKAFEEIYQPGQARPLRLPERSGSLHFLTRLRDEAHRFAVAYHRRLRSLRMSVSALDRIPGVGPAKRRLLLRTFGSVDALLQVPEEELAAVEGIGPELARRIRRLLESGPRVSRPFPGPKTRGLPNDED